MAQVDKTLQKNCQKLIDLSIILEIKLGNVTNITIQIVFCEIQLLRPSLAELARTCFEEVEAALIS